MSADRPERPRDEAGGGGARDELRRAAEREARRRQGDDPTAPQDPAVLLEELRIHQIELELQNEELRRAQIELESLHRKYFELFDDAPVGYVVLEPTGLVGDVNLTAASLLGLTRDRLEKRPFLLSVDPADRHRFDGELRRSTRGETPGSCELRLLRATPSAGGSASTGAAPFWASLEIRPARHGGETGGHLLVFTDIDDRKADERELARLARVRDAGEKVAGMGSYTVSLEDGSSEWSPGMYGVYDVDHGDFHGDATDILERRVLPDDLEALTQRRTALREAGQYEPSEYRVRHRDGSVHILHEGAVIGRDAHGRPESVTGYVQDVTEQTAQRAELERLVRLWEAAEQAGVGSLRFDLWTLAVTLTAGAARLLGLSPDAREIDLRELLRLMQVDDVQALMQVFEQARDTGQLEPFEARVTFPGGDEHVIRVSCIAERDRTGEVASMTGWVQDLTQMRAAQRSLSESEELFRYVFRNSNNGLALVGRDGRFIDVNDAVCAILGRPREDILGHSAYEFLADGETADGGEGQKLIDGYVSSTRSRKRCLRPDGSSRWIDVSSVARRDAAGEIEYAIASVVDVTEEIIAGEQAERRAADLAQRVATTTEQRDALNRELESYAYSIAHDVRTPLRAIDGFSAMALEEEGLSAEGRDALGRVRLATQRLGRLLDDLTGLSLLSHRDVLRQTVDVSALALEVGEELATGNPDLAVDLVVQEGLEAEADPALLRLILRELLGNAWKFTSPHPSAHVEVGAAEQDGEQVLFVRDDGVGFDLHFAEHLFGAFQRMHPSDQFPGDGIGLATVQRLVRRHGGRVWAEAAVEQGATFFFTLSERQTAGDSASS